MRIMKIAAPLVAVALLASCSGEVSGGDSTIRVTRDGPIVPVFHPIRATDNTYPLLYLIYDPLVTLAEDERTIQPGLASEWSVSDDARTFTFTLNDTAKWQDGEPFTAEDVVFTAWWANANASAYQGQPMAWGQVAGAEETAANGTELSGAKALDEHTVEITLAEPNAGFLAAMANAPNVIVPEHKLKDETAATIEASAFVSEPVGTGPFRLTEYVADQYVELTANTDYFRGAPKSGRIIWKILPGPQIAAQLESGDLDLAFGLSQTARGTLEGVEGLSLVDSESVGMVALYTRTEAPALSDRRVRQALYFGIDRQGLIDQVLGGKANLLWNPPGLNFPELEQYPFNPDRARELLAEAGWDPATELQLVYWKDAPYAGEALPIIQQQLAEVGVTATLNPLEVDNWDDMVTNPDRRDEWDLDFEFGGTFGLGPDYSSGSYGSCEGPRRQTGLQNCELAGLFVKARGIVDPDEQAKVHLEMARIINEEADAIYLWQPILLNGVADTLQGVTIYPFDRHSFMRASEWVQS
ncbi:MAG: ABC transporter substrate-binding protein [Propionicimonas sp.]|jgi:peptide/nickel transport system substrate-binding protein